METGYALASSSPALKQESLASSLEEQYFAISKLHDRLELLEAKLEPVFMPQVPCDVAKDSRDKVTSSVRNQIDSTNRSIIWASERIERIIDRLDI